MNLKEAVSWCNKLGKGSLTYYVVYRPMNNDYVTYPHPQIKRHPNSKVVYNSKYKMIYFNLPYLFLPFEN